jgi:hypothetical protein
MRHDGRCARESKRIKVEPIVRPKSSETGWQDSQWNGNLPLVKRQEPMANSQVLTWREWTPTILSCAPSSPTSISGSRFSFFSPGSPCCGG